MLSFKDKIRFALKRLFGRKAVIRNTQRKMLQSFCLSIAIALSVGSGLSFVREDGVSSFHAFWLLLLSMVLLFINVIIISTLEDE